MAKMNYADIANKITAQIGEENVLTVSHCMTRLRFTVKDFSKVSLDDKEDFRSNRRCLPRGTSTGDYGAASFGHL